MVDELQRGCAGPSLFAINDNEIRKDVGREHRLAYGEELPGMADAELEACGLAAGQPPHFADELDQLDGRCEGGVVRWRDAVPSHWHAARVGDLARYFGGRQHATMTRLGALA